MAIQTGRDSGDTEKRLSADTEVVIQRGVMEG